MSGVLIAIRKTLATAEGDVVHL